MEFWKYALIFPVLLFARTVLSEAANQSIKANETHLKIPKKYLQSNTTVEQTKKSDTSKNETKITSGTPSQETTSIRNDTTNVFANFSFKNENPEKLLYIVDNIQETENDEKVTDNQLKPFENNETPIGGIYLFDQVYGNVNGSVDKRQLQSAGLMPGKLAAILAGVFVIISIFGYVFMLSWRRYLENRYGNREMLVEEDYGEKMNDFKHFSI